MDKSIRIGYIFMGPFPYGNVSTLRILSYCAAIAKKRIFVKVYLISPTDEAKVNEQKEGIYQGVHYEYVNGITWDRPNPPLYYKVFKYLQGIHLTLRKLKKENINYLMSYHNEPIANFFFRKFCNKQQCQFILDKTEYPRGIQQQNTIHTAFDKVGLKYYHKVISISHELVAFYRKFLNLSPSSTFLLPMTIDPNRYVGLASNKQEAPYIAVVFGTHNRDNIVGALRSYILYFNLVKKTLFSPMRLKLIGDFELLCAEYPENIKVHHIIAENKLDDYIEFTGVLKSEDIPPILVNATCLLSTPREFISGGFPTKLGEYLLSEVPVVVTSVGEIGLYLKHLENAFIAPPEDFLTIAEQILYIQKFPKEAEIIGKKGKKIASEVFNADSYVDELIKFITAPLAD